MASILTESQLSSFLSHIGLPSSLVHQRYTSDASRDYHLLHQLHVHTISTIPYENLSLHYSSAHAVSINPQVVFDKIVTNNRGRGGYCMENSILYHHVLRALGFPVYMSAVRIRHRINGVPQGNYSGWVHIVNIVTLSNGDKYMNDIGFGGDGATVPLLMSENKPQINIGTQEIRFTRDWIPNQVHRTEQTKLWIYQYRNSAQDEWNSFYAFGEIEAMEPDFYNMNWYTGSHPESFQTFTQIIVKFLRRPKGNDENKSDRKIYGKRMLVSNVIKENLGGKTKVVKECQTEGERMEALKEWFDIYLTEEEQAAIRGWRTELK